MTIHRALLNESLYTWVGRVLGFAAAPLALPGLLVFPAHAYLPASWLQPLGWYFLVVAAVLFVGNSFLCWRRETLGQGASIFPLVFLISAMPAFCLLVSPHWSLGAAAFLVLAALDFMGPWLVSTFVGMILGAKPSAVIENRKFAAPKGKENSTQNLE